MSSSLPNAMTYPQTASSQPSSNSKGSFGPVYLALGIIVVLTLLACAVGRFCARHIQKTQDVHDLHSDSDKSDIEDCFDLKIQATKSSGMKGSIGNPKFSDKIAARPGSNMKQPGFQGNRVVKHATFIEIK